MDKHTPCDNAIALDDEQYAALLDMLAAPLPAPDGLRKLMAGSTPPAATALERALQEEIAQLQALCRTAADALSGLRTAIDSDDATAVERAYIAAAAVQARLERAGGTD